MAPGAPLHLKGTVTIVIAMSAERAGLDRALSYRHDAAVVLQSGPGGLRAGATARAAIAAGATSLLSWGIAGGLEPQMRAGTVVVPKRVAMPGGERFAVDASWQEALADALRPGFAVRDGDLLSVDEVLHSPSDKARAAAATGSVAADMESAAVAQAAASAGLPFAALRVVADSLVDSLPPDVGSWIDSAGRQRMSPVLRAALRPAYWPMLAALAGRYRVARGTLAAAAGVLAPVGFACPAQQRPR
jgi:nucleoside phosphorylase